MLIIGNGIGIGFSQPSGGGGYSFTNPRLAVLGGSRERQSAAQGASNIMNAMTGGVTTWLKALDPRIVSTWWRENDSVKQNSNNMDGYLFANDGNDFTAMARRVNKILATDADIVLVGLTTNAIQSGVTETSYCDQAKAICADIDAAGKLPLVVSLWERNSSTGGVWAIGSAQRLLVPSINTNMAAYCAAQGFLFADIRAVLCDPSNNYEPYAWAVRDGTHFSPRGSYEAAKVVKDVLATAITGSTDADLSTGSNLATAFGSFGAISSVTNMSGVQPSGYAFTRDGNSTSNAVVVASQVTVDGQTAIRLTIDTTALSAGNQEGLILTLSSGPTLTNGDWYTASAKIHAHESDAWIGQAVTLTDSAGKRVTGLAPINSGATPLTSLTDTLLAYPDEEYTAKAETASLQASSTAAGVFTVRVFYTKGTASQTQVIDIYAPQIIPVADPHLLMFNESLALGTTISNGSSYSFPEGAIPTIQIAANKSGYYALSGADAAKWSIDADGLLSRLAVPDYEVPDDADANHVDEVTVTLTPYDTRDSAAVKALSITITDVDDGFTDPMTTAFANNTPLETNTDWTRIGGAAGAVQYQGSSNGIKTTTSTVTAYVPTAQQGNTVEQQVSFMARIASTNNGAASVLVLDEANWLGASWTASAITVRKSVATTVTTQAVFTPYKSVAVADIFLFQIRNIGGVYTLECFMNGVHLGLASGSADVTSLVTGGGALASARKAGLVTRVGTITNWLRAFNNRVAAAITSAVGLYPLTFTSTGNTSASITAGATGTLAISGKIAGADLTIQSITPTPTSGTFTADGNNLQYSGLDANVFTVVLQQNYAGAVNDGRTTSMTVTAA